MAYSDLQKRLDVNNVRELEDLIIDCIYNNLLSAKLDQRGGKLLVQGSFGRDVKEGNVGDLVG